MTVLYRLAADAPAIGRALGVDPGRDPWTGGTVAPGHFAPVVTAGREDIAGPRPDRLPLRMVPRLWGVPPPPSAGDPTRMVTLVRNADSPFWVGNLRNSEFRCLVPATAFLAWGHVDPATNRRRRLWVSCGPESIARKSGNRFFANGDATTESIARKSGNRIFANGDALIESIFAMAGVWKDSEVPGFALLTCEANAALRAHGVERMPVVIPPGDMGTWLRAGWDRAAALAAPFASSATRIDAG
ncbi:MAG: SOS response-associated peptidase family protein [Sphingomonadales bacterium]|nr:SOS response-associated peptidase family protein [Sphingomonadales bacterium]